VIKMINSLQLEKIKEFAVDIDWNHTFDGKSKGNMHLFRMVNLCKELAEKISKNNCPNLVDLSILEAGSWLHDTNLEINIVGDTLANKIKVKRFLQDIGIASEDILQIIHCIEAHDGRVKAKSIEAQLVHDADTLEKMGPLGVIRETWKRSQLGWTSETIAKHLPEHLNKRKNNLYTEIAKNKAEELSQYLEDFFEMLDVQITR